MARLPKRELEQIVKRDLPGYKVVSRGTASEPVVSDASVDQIAADIDTLRQKYLGDEASQSPTNGGVDAGEKSEPNTDDEIVTVQPDKPGAAFDHGARPKTVVVSGKTRRVIGSQG